MFLRILYKSVCYPIDCFNSVFILACLQVRDRATLYLNTLGGDGTAVETDKDVKDFLFGALDIPLANLETSLKNYVSVYGSFM